jgi:hypothetical protein
METGRLFGAGQGVLHTWVRQLMGWVQGTEMGGVARLKNVHLLLSQWPES